MKDMMLQLLLVLLTLTCTAYGEVFGRRRQTGSRRRTGARPDHSVKYGISYTVWYVILGVGLTFIIGLIGAIVYYCLVVRKKDKAKKENEKYRVMGGGFKSKEQKNKEIEEYLVQVKPNANAPPKYEDFDTPPIQNGHTFTNPKKGTKRDQKIEEYLAQTILNPTSPNYRDFATRDNYQDTTTSRF